MRILWPVARYMCVQLLQIYKKGTLNIPQVNFTAQGHMETTTIPGQTSLDVMFLAAAFPTRNVKHCVGTPFSLPLNFQGAVDFHMSVNENFWSACLRKAEANTEASNYILTILESLA